MGRRSRRVYQLGDPVDVKVLKVMLKSDRPRGCSFRNICGGHPLRISDENDPGDCTMASAQQLAERALEWLMRRDRTAYVIMSRAPARWRRTVHFSSRRPKPGTVLAGRSTPTPELDRHRWDDQSAVVASGSGHQRDGRGSSQWERLAVWRQVWRRST